MRGYNLEQCVENAVLKMLTIQTETDSIRAYKYYPLNEWKTPYGCRSLAFKKWFQRAGGNNSVLDHLHSMHKAQYCQRMKNIDLVSKDSDRIITNSCWVHRLVHTYCKKYFIRMQMVFAFQQFKLPSVISFVHELIMIGCY